MEKYFIIKKDSQLYKDYFQWQEDKKNIVKVYDDFAKKHGIESGRFLPLKKRLCIVPSERDKDKFRNDLTLEYMDNGLRQFKVRSTIGKDWINAVADLRIAMKPNYFGLVRVYGRYSERLFNIKDTLYGSLSANSDFKLHDCMEEIKASDFYKVIEDYNASISKENE